MNRKRARVAVLTNAVPAYRRPVFEALSRMPDLDVRIIVSLPPQASDAQAIAALPIRYSRGINIRRKTRHAQVGAVQTEWLHVPLLLPWDLLRCRPDIIISGEFGLRSLVAYLVSRWRRIPLVLWSEETRECARSISRLQARVRTFLIARATAFLAWGEPAGAYLRSFGVPADKIYRCAQAVDNEFWARACARHDRARVRAQLGVRGRMFLAAGRLLARKGFDCFLKAWAGLPSAVRDSHTVVIAGDGPEADPLRRLAAGLGLRNVHFVGAQSPDGLAKYYAAADVFVFPSLVDVWGLVVNEAMACGLPVLGSRHAGASQQLIANDAVGEQFDPTDIAEFSDVLRRWCTRTDQVSPHRPVAEVSKLSFDVTIEALRRVVDDHLGDGNRPSTLQLAPRVLIVTLLAEHGETGVQSHFNSFRVFLERSGYDVLTVTPFRISPVFVYPVFAARRIIDLLSGAASVWWYRYWHYFFLRLALRRALSDGRTAVIYAQCPLSAKAALEARRSAHPPVVLAVHFNVSQADEWVQKGRLKTDGRLYRAIRGIEARVLPKLDGLVYVSRFMQAQLEQRIPTLREVRAAVIPNFHERETVTRPGAEIAGDLISIGTLEPRKNQRYLLNVLAHAARQGKRYTLTLVGDGPERTALERLARDLGIADLIQFAGFRPNAARLLPGHRVYVHGAVMETFGIVLAEAMGAGLPVMAPPVGGIPEVFRDGVEGRYWPLDDAAEGARRLVDLLEDRDLYLRMSAAAVHRFNEHYEMTKVAGRLRDFLLGVTPKPLGCHSADIIPN